MRAWGGCGIGLAWHVRGMCIAPQAARQGGAVVDEALAGGRVTAMGMHRALLHPQITGRASVFFPHGPELNVGALGRRALARARQACRSQNRRQRLAQQLTCIALASRVSHACRFCQRGGTELRSQRLPISRRQASLRGGWQAWQGHESRCSWLPPGSPMGKSVRSSSHTLLWTDAAYCCIRRYRMRRQSSAGMSPGCVHSVLHMRGRGRSNPEHASPAQLTPLPPSMAAGNGKGGRLKEASRGSSRASRGSSRAMLTAVIEDTRGAALTLLGFDLQGRPPLARLRAKRYPP